MRERDPRAAAEALEYDREAYGHDYTREAYRDRDRDRDRDEYREERAPRAREREREPPEEYAASRRALNAA